LFIKLKINLTEFIELKLNVGLFILF